MLRQQSKIEILDTTLRDGMQGQGISFSVENKISIVRALDKLGIAYLEAGNPGSNPKDLEFFKRMQSVELYRAKLVAFGSTRRPGILVSDDQNCQALLATGVGIVSLVGKSWDLHVTDVLRCSLEENLAMIRDTVSYFVAQGRSVQFDAEHFFDGYKANPTYAIDTLKAAAGAGASVCTLCDTNGGCFPDEITQIIQAVQRQVSVPLGIHCHNDIGSAAANTYAAVEAGVRHVQGTYLGFGERCGNANLTTVIPALQLKRGYSCIPDEQMRYITKTARFIADVSNLTLSASLPFVGNSAFAHKAGMHVDGVNKNHASFEHIDPKAVGNRRNILLSEVSGRGAVLSQMRQVDAGLTKESPETLRVIEILKDLEKRGFQFESAAASFELLVRRQLGRLKPYFSLEHFRIIEQREAANDTTASVLIKVRVGDEVEVTAAESEDGPVDALDRALRKALEVFYPSLSSVRLIDYKVRVMDSESATAASVRVLIESTDGEQVWTTVGASTDIINASWMALEDSVQYKLMRDEEREREIH